MVGNTARYKVLIAPANSWQAVFLKFLILILPDHILILPLAFFIILFTLSFLSSNSAIVFVFVFECHKQTKSLSLHDVHI